MAMQDFPMYLLQAQEGLNNLDQYNNVDIILGNESCDLDSTVCTLALGFYMYKSIAKCDSSVLILPIMNINADNFMLRTENCYILKKCNIDINQLIFRNQVNLSTILDGRNVGTHLVDHHVLAPEVAILENTIVQIIDHRPIDSCALPLLQKINAKIEEVGSCATLVADDILKKNDTLLCDEAGLLLYAAIVYDTIALEPENGRAKQLDIDIAMKLETIFKFDQTPKDMFQDLWSAHCDISHLTPKQMLYKDLKIVDGIPVPGLPLLFEDYLKLENAQSYIREFAEEHKSTLVIFIGLDAKKEVKRDIGIYFEDSNSLKDNFIQNLLNCKLERGYDFDLVEVELSTKNVLCFKQNNIKLTRKQIIPIARDSVIQNKSSNK